MPNRDGTGPRVGSRGPRNGRGFGRLWKGRGRGIGRGRGGRRGICFRRKI